MRRSVCCLSVGLALLLAGCGGEEPVEEQGSRPGCARAGNYHCTFHLTSNTCPAGVALPFWSDALEVKPALCRPQAGKGDTSEVLAANCDLKCSWTYEPYAEQADRVHGQYSCDLSCPTWATGANPELIGKTCTYKATYVGLGSP